MATVGPRGQSMCRAIIALVRAGDSAVDHAAAVWGENAAATQVLKANVPGLDTASTLADVAVASAEISELLSTRAVLGRLAGNMKIPLNTRVIVPLADPVAYWAGQGSAIPAAMGAVTSVTLNARKTAAIFPITQELARFGGPLTETLLRNMLMRALITAQDAKLLGALDGGNAAPKGLAFGLTPIASTNDAHADIVTLWDAYQGDSDSAVIITDPRTAAALAAIRTDTGTALFPDCGPRGGTVLGVPLLTSRGSPRDSSGGQLLMVDAQSIVYGDGMVRVDKAPHATVEMLDNPTSSSVSPQGTTVVSMFQTNCVAICIEQEINWALARDGTVAVIQGATYV